MEKFYFPGGSEPFEIVTSKPNKQVKLNRCRLGMRYLEIQDFSRCDLGGIDQRRRSRRERDIGFDAATRRGAYDAGPLWRKADVAILALVETRVNAVFKVFRQRYV